MTPSFGSSSALFVVLLLLAPISGAAPAPEDGVTDKNAQAVELGRVGLEEYGVDNWPKAFEAFEQAERASHSPVFLLYMARCKRNLGSLLAARSLYARVLEDMPASPPDPWLRAARDARREAADVQAYIPSVVISVRSNGPALAELSLDGIPASPNVEIEVDPGTHRVVAKGNNGVTAEGTIAVEEKARRVSVTLTLPAPRPAIAPVAAVPHATATTKPPTPIPADELERGPNVPAYVTGAIGLAGIAVGTVTGIVAMAKLDDIKKNCDFGGHCDPDDEWKMRSVNTFANVSTISFVVGGAGLGVSAVLFLVEPAAPQASARAVPRESVAFRVTTMF